MASSDPFTRALPRVPSPVGRRCLGAEQVQQQLCRDRFSIFAVSSLREFSLLFRQWPNKRPNESREDCDQQNMLLISLSPAVYFASSDIIRIAICRMNSPGVGSLWLWFLDYPAFMSRFWG
jgi:hypothetical protein